MKIFSLETCYGVEFKFCGYYHRIGIYRKLNNYWIKATEYINRLQGGKK